MLGRTHYKLGIGYYLIFLPVTISIYAVNRIDQLLLGVIVAGLAALLPDIDTPTSKINNLNPITRIPIKIVDTTTTFILFIIRSGISLGAAYLLWTYSEGQAKGNDMLLKALAVLLAIMGVFGGRIMKHLPIYNLLDKGATAFSLRVRKIIINGFVYAVVAAAYIYNIRNNNDWVIYLLGIVLIASTVFPHRTFTHSLEGFLLYSYYAYHLAELFGHQYLAAAFIVGYGSHLYLADIFSDGGIPLSFLPHIFERTGIHAKMKDKGSRVYNAIYKALSIRLKVSLMKTGSGWEALYYSVVLVIALYVLQRSFNSLDLMLMSLY